MDADWTLRQLVGIVNLSIEDFVEIGPNDTLKFTLAKATPMQIALLEVLNVQPDGVFTLRLPSKLKVPFWTG